MPLDESLLQPGHSPTAEDGPRATFHKDGQLAHFGIYRRGEPAGWTLSLDPQSLAGAVTRVQRNVYVAEDGFDPDTGEPIHVAYPEWVKSQVEMIYRDAGGISQQCSFCGKGNTEVRKLIAGPSSYICDECVSLCSHILSEG